MKIKGFILAVMMLGGMAVQAESYHLTKVTSVADGGKYVFVKNGRVICAETSPYSYGALLSTTEYKSTGLTGEENYVWSMQKAEFGYHMVNGIAALNNKDNSNLEFVSAANASTEWKYQLTNDSIRIWSRDSSRYLGLTGKSSVQYKLYDGKPVTDHPSKLALYRLDLDSYERTVSGMPLGTICLPFTSEKATGANFYEVAYKEMTGEVPGKVVFAQVEGPLLAGHAYVLEPTAEEISFEPVADSYVSAPIADNGLMGTFVAIQDQATTKSSNKLEGKYMINAAGQIQLCGAGCSLGAYRAYINIKNVPEKDEVAAPTRRLLVIGQSSAPEYINPGSSTAVEDVPLDMHKEGKSIVNGQVVIRCNGSNYSIGGNKL